ncbi:MAG: ABC transporter permease, partial [Roseburia hominis]
EISLLKDTEEPYQFSQQFLLTGIVNSNYIGYVSGTIDGIVGEGTAENILPEKYMVYSVDVRTKEKSAFQNVIYSLEKNMRYLIHRYSIMIHFYPQWE